MAVAFELRQVIIDQIEKWRKELNHPVANRPVGLAKQIGAIMVKESQRAFQKQALGDIQWPERYPGMTSPKINIAGALADFISGRAAPKPNRFQDRPALVDEGMRGGLWGSISSRVKDDLTVMVGTNKEYAGLHQEGGISSQNYGDDVRSRIQDWLYKRKSTKIPMSKKNRTPRKGREGYAEKLAPLLFTNTYTQKVKRRPFIGVTDQAEQEIRMAIERYFAGFKP